MKERVGRRKEKLREGVGSDNEDRVGKKAELQTRKRKTKSK